MTMAIDPEQLPIAKEMIQEFMEKLSEVLQVKKTNVYELQINLFPLQRGSK
jgi:acyl-CoA thioesterase